MRPLTEVRDEPMTADGLVLRRPRPGDAALVHRGSHDPLVREFLQAVVPHLDTAAAAKWLAEVPPMLWETGRAAYFALEDAASGEPVGWAELVNPDPVRECAEGTFRATRATRADRERTGRIDPALIRRVLAAAAQFPAPAPADTPAAGRRLTVQGQPGQADRQWTDGTAAPVPADATVLDALLAQALGEADRPAALPAALARTEPDAGTARSAAAVGTVAGRAAYALVEADGAFGLTALDDAAPLGGSDADAGLAPTAVALGEAGGRSLFAVGSTDGSVQVWDAATGAVAHGTTGGEGAQSVAALVCRDIPVVFSAGQSGDLRAVRADDGRVLGTLPTGGRGASALRAVHCAGVDLLAAASPDGTVRVWDAGSGDLLHLLVGHRGEVLALAVLTVDNQAVLASAGQD